MRIIRITITALALLTVAAAPASAVLSFFDVVSNSEAVSGPPYPTACHRTEVAHEAVGAFESDGQFALGVRLAVDDEGSRFGTDILATSFQTPANVFQDYTSFDVMYCPDAGGSERSPSGRLDLMTEITTNAERPAKLLALHEELPVADPERYFDIVASSWSVEVICMVEFERGIRHELTLLAELPTDVSLTGASLAILPQTTGAHKRTGAEEVEYYFTPRPDAFFDLRLSIQGDDGFDDLQPMMSLTYTGRFLGGTSPVEASTWGAIKALFQNP